MVLIFFLSLIPAGGAFLFDCGEGTVRQMLNSSVKPYDIKAVFLTHLHGDHFYGIPGLGMTLLSASYEVPLFAPPGLTQCFKGVFGLRGFKLHSIQKPAVQTKEDDNDIIYNSAMARYKIYEDQHYLVEANIIRHSVFCLGYVITEKISRGPFNLEKMKRVGLKQGPVLKDLSEGKTITLPDGRLVNPEDVMDPPRQARKIVILGDTYDPSPITGIAVNADVLVHEATYANEEKSLALIQMHSTAGMAGEFARRINAKNLVLTHFSPRGFNDNQYNEITHVKKLVEQARTTFGKHHVFPADDFWKFKVPLPFNKKGSSSTDGASIPGNDHLHNQEHQQTTKTKTKTTLSSS